MSIGCTALQFLFLLECCQLERSPGHVGRLNCEKRDRDTRPGFALQRSVFHSSTPHDRDCVDVDECWENNCGAGVCRDLSNPTSKSTEHCACDCGPGYAEVVVGGTHKTCRNNCSLGYEGVQGQGCKDVNECFRWGGNAASFPGAWHNDVGAYSCTCPSGSVSVAEDCKPHCRSEVCGKAPIGKHASENGTGNMPHGRAVRHTCDAGHIIQDGVLDSSTEWTVSCDAGGAFIAGYMCFPVKCTLPTVANAENPHGEVLYCESVTYGCQSGFSADGMAVSATSLSAVFWTDGQAHPVGECKPVSRMPSLTTEITSTARVLRTTVSVATQPQVSLWAAPPSQARGQRVVSLLPQLLAERCPVDFTLMSTVSPRHLMRCSSRPL